MILIFNLLVFCAISSVNGAKKPAVVAKEDLKYISCDVCEKMVSALSHHVDLLRPTSSKKGIDELSLIETIEGICNPHNSTGEWIRSLDIVEFTSRGLHYLKLEEPGGISKCGNECVTIAKSCEKLLDEEVEVDDLAAMYLKKKSFSVRDYQVYGMKKVCSSMTKRCKTASPHLDAKYKRIDVEFKAQTAKEIELEAMMANMKAQGLSSTVYDKDNMDDLMGSMDLDGDEDNYADDSFGGGGLGGLGEGFESDKPFDNAGSKYEF